MPPSSPSTPLDSSENIAGGPSARLTTSRALLEPENAEKTGPSHSRRHDTIEEEPTEDNEVAIVLASLAAAESDVKRFNPIRSKTMDDVVLSLLSLSSLLVERSGFQGKRTIQIISAELFPLEAQLFQN